MSMKYVGFSERNFRLDKVKFRNTDSGRLIIRQMHDLWKALVDTARAYSDECEDEAISEILTKYYYGALCWKDYQKALRILSSIDTKREKRALSNLLKYWEGLVSELEDPIDDQGYAVEFFLNAPGSIISDLKGFSDMEEFIDEDDIHCDETSFQETDEFDAREFGGISHRPPGRYVAP